MADDPGQSVVEQVLAAPALLVRPACEDFRRAAMAVLDGLPPGRGRLVLDFRATTDADSVGMAALIAIRRRARARGQPVLLRGVAPPFGELLRMVKLDGQFESERG
jgi:ABC-type transporter Mla MlaB component